MMRGITPCKAPVFERPIYFIFDGKSLIPISFQAKFRTHKNGSNGASKHPNEPDHKSPKSIGGNNG